MRFEQLEYLIEISKHPSLSAAALKLHLTSQALSMSISSMEDELGLTILERSYKGVQLTDDGKKVVAAATNFLLTLESIQNKNTSKALTSLSGNHELLTIYGEINGMLLTLLTSLFQDMPDVHISTIRTSQKEVEDRLISEKNEFAMFYNVLIDGENIVSFDKNLSFTPLTSCQLYALVPNHFPASMYKTASLKTLLDYPFILYQNNENAPANWLNILEYFGTPKQIITHTSRPLCHSLISAGLGIGLYMMPVIKTQLETPALENVAHLVIRDDIQINYGYLTLRDHKFSDDAHILLDYIKQCLEF